MYKTPMICSLLMAFGLSALMVGCEPAKMGGTKPAGKPSTPGSTTGRGADVPDRSKGADEVPKAPEKPAEPAPKAEDAPKAEEAPKADAPKEEPKADAPKTDDAAKTEEAPKN